LGILKKKRWGQVLPFITAGQSLRYTLYIVFAARQNPEYLNNLEKDLLKSKKKIAKKATSFLSATPLSTSMARPRNSTISFLPSISLINFASAFAIIY
jgi:hypothetical protein